MTGGDSDSRPVTPTIDIDVLDGAIAFRDLLASCFGPDARKLMIVTDDGPLVTSDLHRLLDEVEFAHPVTRLVAAGAVEQKETVGDGSLAAVLLVGGLAARARALLNDGHRRDTIAEGFARAGAVATSSLSEYSDSIHATDEQSLVAVARGALASAVAETQSEVVPPVVDAARLVATERAARSDLTAGDFQFRHVGGEASRVELIRGTVLEEAPVSEATPRTLENVGIAVIGGGRKAGSGIEERSLKREGGEPGQGRTAVTFSPETPEDVEEFRESERQMVDDQIEALLTAGTDVVFCTMGISEAAQARLEAEGIPAFRGLTGEQSRRLARSIGASVVMHLPDIRPSDLGQAGRFHVVADGDETYVRIEDCPNGEVATIVLRGSVGEAIEELERDLRAAIVSTLAVLEGEAVVPGGGTIELALANEVESAARGVPDRSAIAMDAYADAIVDLPRTLVRNAGSDPIDVIPTLRSAGAEATFDAIAGGVRPVENAGPLLPRKVVRSTIQLSTELAVQLVRIDEVVAAADEEPAVTDPDFRPKPGRDDG